MPKSEIQIQCQAVLLDIEGTVCPVAFVFDVMFPYIREHVLSFLRSNWNIPAVQEAVALVGKDIGQDCVETWLGQDPDQPQTVASAVNQLMDDDAKVTGLKQLQGLIWKDGFDSGQLVAELFPDVLPRLKEWKAAGLDLYIYSSGSIGAQKLFFGHTIAGNLLTLFSGHFDTTIGNKKIADSYTKIGRQTGLPSGSICFISDVIAELDAAVQAGMQTIWRPVPGDEGVSSSHPAIDTFTGIVLAKDLPKLI